MAKCDPSQADPKPDTVAQSGVDLASASGSASGDALSDDEATFGARVRSAMAWRWGSQILSQILTWGSTIIVVRLLDPSDYGLFAMSQVVVTALAFLNGYSFATSLVQARHVDERRIGQVFGLLLLLAAALGAAQYAIAPLVADYYNQPIVEKMLRYQALIFLTTPFIALPTSLLQRRLEFRKQAVVNMVSAIIAAITALILAWLGYGVWALIWAPVTSFYARSIGLTIAARALVRPVFNFRGAGDLLTFGGALTICQFFWIIQSQSDIFIAGRVFDPHDLGLYSEALFLTIIITGRFLPPVNEVALPAYSELHKNGRPVGPFFIRTLRTVLLVTAPLYIGLALTAPEAVYTLFGPKWTEMAPIVAGLCLAMPLMSLQIVCSPATNAMGRPRIYVLTSAAGAVIMPCAFLYGIQAGPIGLVHAWWIAAPLLLGVTLMLTLPAVGVQPGVLIKELTPAAIACAVMAVAVYGLRYLAAPYLPAPALLLLLVVVGGVSYLGCLLGLWPQLVRECWDMLRGKPGSGAAPAYPHSPAISDVSTG